MQADVKIGVSDARIGFAGPAVILNTMYEMEQSKYDLECPDAFQSAQFLDVGGGGAPPARSIKTGGAPPRGAGVVGRRTMRPLARGIDGAPAAWRWGKKGAGRSQAPARCRQT
eukprot:gene12977-22654_t